MSTVVVVRKDGVAAIGADTLTTYDDTRESADYIANHSKILQVGDSYLARVDHASWGHVLASYFARRDPPALDSPLAIYEVARHLHQTLVDEYFLHPTADEDDPFLRTGLGCLIANPAGIFGLYHFRSVQEYSRYYAFGSGYPFALGAMYVSYGTGASAEEVARAGLEAAAEFDQESLRPVIVHIVALR